MSSIPRIVNWDMSPEDLIRYQGSSPLPQDFDQYWERALNELKSTPENIEMKESSFQVPSAQCFDLFFSGVKGAKIHAKYLKPRNKANNDGKKSRAIVQFHGYSGSSGDWGDKLAYVAQGFHVLALDCRGQGGQSEDLGGSSGNTLHGHIIRGIDGGEDALLYRSIFLDVLRSAQILMAFDDVDETQVMAMGGSQGGALALVCAALEPRIKKVAVQYPFLSDYCRVWEAENARDAYGELEEYFRRFDPMHQNQDQFFYKLGYIDIQNLAPRVKAETLWAVGYRDRICPPSTQFAAYNKLRCPKKLHHYPDFGHEGLPGWTDTVLQYFLQD